MMSLSPSVCVFDLDEEKKSEHSSYFVIIVVAEV